MGVWEVDWGLVGEVIVWVGVFLMIGFWIRDYGEINIFVMLSGWENFICYKESFYICLVRVIVKSLIVIVSVS